MSDVGTPTDSAKSETPWAVTPESVLAELGTSADGLTAARSAEVLARVGPNRLPEPARAPLWLRFVSHFQDVLIYILLVSAALKAILGHWIDFAVILAVAVINAAIGFVQEGRAEQALAGIKEMLSADAHALRDGNWSLVDAELLVPGDIVRVRTGDRVPADIRLIDAVNLRVEESALTGESVPSAKQTDPVGAETGVGDRSNMLFSGTLVVAGTGEGVVVGTGIHTEIGQITTLMSDVESLETPLTRTLAAFGKRLALLILLVALAMVLVGKLVHDIPVPELLSAAIGFAVAAVPEGLPALVTITLALGVQQMAKRRAITRKLTAVETLGSVTTICSDKTGTLTKNEMTARSVRTRGSLYAVSGLGYAPHGALSLGDRAAALEEHADLHALISVMALCNDARVEEDGDTFALIGEPTEGALHVLGLKAGFDTSDFTRVAVVPFESETKYMATLDADGTGSLMVHLKGAPDRVLARCTTQTTPDGGSEPIDDAFWTAQIDDLGGQGLRVLAAARRAAAPGTATLDDADLAKGFELTGLVGIVDPPRPEAIEAIEKCRTAGIGVKMITGDHAGTALAIGREMGIVSGDDVRVLTGEQLEAMSASELREAAPDVDIYARTSPEHKIRIVSALQARGKVVAMTGDGMNDAPALTQAEVGVAMGIKGTDATKEAAEIVLADDNFATIERAVEEGRRIYDNLRKSVLFLLPTNGAQSLVILVSVLFGLALPLEPVQVLWVNMVTALTLSLALANERAEADIMDRAPRDPSAPILDPAALRRIVLVSLLIGGATLAVFYTESALGAGRAQAQTAAVTMLALGQLAYLFNCRFLDRSSLSPEVLRGNPAVWWSMLALIVLQGVFAYAPFMHLWFGSAPIGPREWGITLALAFVVFVLVEAAKAVGRGRTAHRP